VRGGSLYRGVILVSPLDLISVLPADFLLLVFSAFLISLDNGLEDFKTNKFLKERFVHFLVILACLFIIVIAFNWWVFGNSPNYNCNVWEEKCIPMAQANTHSIVQAIFALSVFFFVVSVMALKANEFLEKSKDKRRKRRVLYSLKHIVMIFVTFVVGGSLLFAWPYVFLEKPTMVQPLVFLYDYVHEDKASFYFLNSADEDKLITTIVVFCNSRDTGEKILVTDWEHSWDGYNCEGLPKIVPSNQIVAITCKANGYAPGCDDKSEVAAYTRWGSYYSTIFVPQ